MFCLAAFPLLAAAQSPPPGNNSLLHLSETAQRDVPRDRLRADLAVDFTDLDAAKVQAEINRHMAAALTRIKAVPDVAIETNGYSVYQDRSDKGPQRWHGSQSFALTSKNFAALLVLVGTLQ